MRKSKVLFVCTHNSARSQMAEGLLRHLQGDAFEVHSAGTERTRVHPLAITAMAELGVDLSAHRSKTLDEFTGQSFDWVITVCDAADDACPVFPGRTRRLHWSFPDPSKSQGGEEARLATFRQVRDAIAERLKEFVAQQRPPSP